MNDLKIFSGSAHKLLAKEICDYLKIPLGKSYVGRFADDEINVKIEENVRGIDCFIVQPTCPPVNEHFMELLIMIDALSRASARRITAVMPYFGYSRQDRKVEPRVPITAKLVSNMLVAAGVDRVLTTDLHAGQIQGFFDIPVDNLSAQPVLLDYLKTKQLDSLIMVSPDTGGVERTREFAKKINADLSIIDKRRPKANQASVMHIIGDVAGKNAVILDDLVDTAGTLVKVSEALMQNNTKSVMALCTHGLFSGKAIELITNSSLTEIVATNTVPLAKEKAVSKIKVLSIAPLFGEAIRRIHNEESVSELFR